MPLDLDRVEIGATATGSELWVKVVPGASRTRIAGRLGSALKLTVSAPPAAGQANAAVLDLLATTLGVRGGDLAIVGGQTRPLKRIAVAGLDPAEVRRRLSTCG